MLWHSEFRKVYSLYFLLGLSTFLHSLPSRHVFDDVLFSIWCIVLMSLVAVDLCVVTLMAIRPRQCGWWDGTGILTNHWPSVSSHGIMGHPIPVLCYGLCDCMCMLFVCVCCFLYHVLVLWCDPSPLWLKTLTVQCPPFVRPIFYLMSHISATWQGLALASFYFSFWYLPLIFAVYDLVEGSTRLGFSHNQMLCFNCYRSIFVWAWGLASTLDVSDHCNLW